MTGDLRITLVRSLSGRTEHVRRVVRGLGLTRLHRSVTRKNTPEIRGMVEKAKFLLRVEIVGESE
ncbi:MAG: 50S ribosomal protein L30 [Deltaproteobacteria bacterium]|jgi:large subunit ribosomal protein L30|nr:50S ribosomal protein L30 [Deltaproteobacteria bacterium]TFG60144.1 MAG: 50S ribosomal protein L30 [Deltaproteobacteria bacterium]